MAQTRYSKKREAVLNAINGTTIHPSAEWVYEQLRPDYPGISLGMVYRNIARFKEEGRVISVGVVNGEERIDGRTAPHAHFICTRCGAVLELCEPETGGKLIDAVHRELDAQVDHWNLVFYGICKNCRER